MVEYEALIHGTKILLDFKIRCFYAYSDSLLKVNQFYKEWRVRDAKLTPYQVMTLEHIVMFEEFYLFHTKREYNKFIDGLASLNSIIAFRTIESSRAFEVGSLHQPAYEPNLEILQVIDDEPPW